MFNWGCGFNGPTGNCPDNHGEDVDFGSSPILVALGGGKQILVAGQKSGMVHGFDPDRNGKIVWQTRIGQGGKLGGVEWGMAASGGVVFAPLSDWGLPRRAGSSRWMRPPAKLSGRRRLRSLRAPGNQDALPPQLAPATAVPGVVFSGSMDGHLRAYRMTNGEIIWDFDTNREFPPSTRFPRVAGRSAVPAPPSPTACST